MKKATHHNQVQFTVSDADLERLHFCGKVFELSTTECLRHFIRTYYAALGDRPEGPPTAQMPLFPTVMPDGKTPLPLPLPKPVPEQKP